MDCGGAPQPFVQSVVYDVEHAAPFTVESLLRLDTDDQRAAFERLWMSRVRARLAANDPDLNEDCTDFNNGATTSLRVSATGLVVEHAVRSSWDVPCAVDLAELSLSDLRPFLRDGAADYWR